MSKLKKKHPFSKTLGAGPYTFVRYIEITLCPRVGTKVIGRTDDLEKGVGTCDHCGKGIMHNYIVQIGNGKKFAVGSDCILKLQDQADFTNYTAFERKLAEEKRRKGREYRARKLKEMTDEIKQLTTDAKNIEVFKQAPHPSEYFKNNKAWTFYSYVNFYNGKKLSYGAAVKLKEKIKKVLKETNK